MLTDRGWAGLGVAAALVVLWVSLGEIELLAAGVIVAVALVAALAITRLSRPNVGVVRRLSPSLVHEGDRAAVDAVITNHGRRTLTNVAFVDEVGSLGRAVFEAGTIGPGMAGNAEYQILCRPRGVYPVGPVTATVTDPLRLAKATVLVPAVDRLIVYPEVEDLVGFPMTRGRDPAMQASRPEFSQRGGEDFYTLREYVFGDDLRRVHWPSSAKKDELMIRQLETPWQSRALVILDLRWRTYESEECFEKAVRGAASIVRHLAREGFDADLWAGGVAATPISQYSAVMEKLAVVEREGRLDIRGVAARLKSVGRGGALVLVTGIPDSDLLEVQRLMAREYRTTVVMSASETASSGEIAFQRAGAVTLNVTPTESWAAAWAKVVGKTWSNASSG
ncbi:MAG TPA: DUF58 domain-containing protein [Acidimicrobiia bacterium]|nr:DUF58 domain-containing protein [Acidimicrobiia bacterium]